LSDVQRKYEWRKNEVLNERKRGRKEDKGGEKEVKQDSKKQRKKEIWTERKKDKEERTVRFASLFCVVAYSYLYRRHLILQVGGNIVLTCFTVLTNHSS
jgi:uncharacterized membrane protein YccC